MSERRKTIFGTSAAFLVLLAACGNTSRKEPEPHNPPSHTDDRAAESEDKVHPWSVRLEDIQTRLQDAIDAEDAYYGCMNRHYPRFSEDINLYGEDYLNFHKPRAYVRALEVCKPEMEKMQVTRRRVEGYRD